jgi:Spy/CpxP family protein refolding chaperone
MRRLHLLVLSLVAVIALSLAMKNAGAQPPDGPQPQDGGQQGQNDRPQGDRPPGGFHLIPRFAEEKLELSDDQKEQIKQLEAEVKTKLEAILTPEQMKTLETACPPRPNNNGGGQGGQGGQGGGQNSRGQNNGNRPPRPTN